MYKATLISKEEKPTELSVVIEYSNGVDSFRETKTTNGGFFTVEQLKEQVKARVDLLNSQTDIAKELVIGDIPEPTPVKTVVKTVDELAFEAFMKDYLILKKVNGLISDGVLTGSEVQVTALKDKVKSEFDVNFINLI